jgi:methylmalonyl-CoA mutase cobalamin-binding domain/chain
METAQERVSEGSYVDRLRKAVLEYDLDGVERLAQEALERGVPPVDAIEKGLASGIREVGEKFGAGELFLPELVMAAETMRAGVGVLQPHLAAGAGRGSRKRVLLATVQDDIHEIGKNLVGALLTANGYEVVDLGVNQSTATILSKFSETQAEVVAVSALMTTSMPRLKEVLTEAERRGVRTAGRFIVGGAPVTAQYAAEIHSDGTSGDAAGAVTLVRHLLSAPKPAD